MTRRLVADRRAREELRGIAKPVAGAQFRGEIPLADIAGHGAGHQERVALHAVDLGVDILESGAPAQLEPVACLVPDPAVGRRTPLVDVIDRPLAERHECHRCDLQREGTRRIPLGRLVHEEQPRPPRPRSAVLRRLPTQLLRPHFLLLDDGRARGEARRARTEVQIDNARIEFPMLIGGDRLEAPRVAIESAVERKLLPLEVGHAGDLGAHRERIRAEQRTQALAAVVGTLGEHPKPPLGSWIRLPVEVEDTTGDLAIIRVGAQRRIAQVAVALPVIELQRVGESRRKRSAAPQVRPEPVVGTVLGLDREFVLIPRPARPELDQPARRVAPDPGPLRTAKHPHAGRIEQIRRVAEHVTHGNVVDHHRHRGRAEEQRVGGSPHAQHVAEAAAVIVHHVQPGNQSGEIRHGVGTKEFEFVDTESTVAKHGLGGDHGRIKTLQLGHNGGRAHAQQGPEY